MRLHREASRSQGLRVELRALPAIATAAFAAITATLALQPSTASLALARPAAARVRRQGPTALPA